jgi:predicted naringenin-chalcone synthase
MRRKGPCPVTTAYINDIATAVPPHDVHAAFLAFGRSLFGNDRPRAALFRRMAAKSGIEHRFSFLAPGADPAGAAVDRAGFYVRGRFPGTGARMRFFEAHAADLASLAVDRLLPAGEHSRITHLVVTCCTGLSAPGLDLELIERCRLPHSVERTLIGFMGCYAAINALRLAAHIVRSEPAARVLVVSLELCTLHLQETCDLETVLSFLLWGDGCAAALVSAEPCGLSLDSFRSVLVPETQDLIEWRIRDRGFDMTLSGKVPAAIQEGLSRHGEEILAGASPAAIDLWAVHPGGRTVLDAVERAFQLVPQALSASRHVLRCYGNMSSATVLFVLEALMRRDARGTAGCAMSFGPGLVAETMLFRAGRNGGAPAGRA